MYYSNKLLKPTTACVIVRIKKNPHGTGIEQINCRFIRAMFFFKSAPCLFFAIFVRVLPRIITSACKKKLCSAT